MVKKKELLVHDDNSFHGKETNGPKYPLKDPALSLEFHGWCEIEKTPSTVNNQQKSIVQHMELCSVLCSSLDGGLREDESMNMHG